MAPLSHTKLNYHAIRLLFTFDQFKTLTRLMQTSDWWYLTQTVVPNSVISLLLWSPSCKWVPLQTFTNQLPICIWQLRGLQRIYKSDVVCIRINKVKNNQNGVISLIPSKNGWQISSTILSQFYCNNRWDFQKYPCNSHPILTWQFIIWEPCLMTPFVSISGCGLLLKQARQQESKQQEP